MAIFGYGLKSMKFFLSKKTDIHTLLNDCLFVQILQITESCLFHSYKTSSLGFGQQKNSKKSKTGKKYKRSKPKKSFKMVKTQKNLLCF